MTTMAKSHRTPAKISKMLQLKLKRLLKSVTQSSKTNARFKFCKTVANEKICKTKADETEDKT